MLDPLILAGLTLAIIHFGIPLAYYGCMKRFYNKDSGIEPRDNSNQLPLMSVIVPTYNEAKFIEEKLDNIYQQDYPRNKLEIIVVDSGSTDGTPEKVLEWSKNHPDIVVKLIREPVRRGKAYALNEALKHLSGEIVVITDADSKWLHRDTLKRVATYLSIPHIGAVSCIKLPETTRPGSVEASYRDFYNILRVAESNYYSTPVFHGELAVYRKNLLLEIGGFPTDIGADDSHTATLIALKGYRAITAKDLVCVEAVPHKDYHLWRIRRAQHLIQHFWKTLRLKPETPKQFKKILYTEIYLHLLNPWILLLATILLISSAVMKSLLAAALLTAGVALLAYKPYRAWIATQVYLIAATIRNLWTKEIIWSKQSKA